MLPLRFCFRRKKRRKKKKSLGKCVKEKWGCYFGDIWKKILSRLSTQIQQTFQSFYGFCVNLSIKYIVRLGYINIIVCSAEAMVEFCNIDELNVWMDDCECKA